MIWSVVAVTTAAVGAATVVWATKKAFDSYVPYEVRAHAPTRRCPALQHAASGSTMHRTCTPAHPSLACQAA